MGAMYPTLPLGPISLPTGPVFALLAFWFGLETAARYSRRVGGHPDEVWNTGLLAVLAGLIVARLFHAVQFWAIYSAEPLLVFSLRPSGFSWGPGLAAALVGGYAYLWRRRSDPLRVAAALAVGGLATGVVLGVGAHLTGSAVGMPSTLPWAMPHYGELLHPVGYYRALGLLLWLAAMWAWDRGRQPARTLWMAAFGAALVWLIAEAFRAEPPLLGPFRSGQIAALALALVASLILARGAAEPQSAPSVSGDLTPASPE